MSLLTIAQGVALNVGVESPDSITGSSDRTDAELLEQINLAGEELARRVDWGALTKTTTVNGTGTDDNFTLPTDFDRMATGACVVGDGGAVRALSQGEFANLPTASAADPRYYLLRNNIIRFFPILPANDSVTVTYQSSDWVTDGTNAAALFTSDSETSLIPEYLLEMSATVKWLRQKAQPFADREAEYEAALAGEAQFDDRGRL